MCWWSRVVFLVYVVLQVALPLARGLDEREQDLPQVIGPVRLVPVPTTTLRGVTPEYVIVDPSAAGFRVQLYRDGITARLGDNTVLDGIRTVSSLLALDLLRVHSSCTALAAEMAGYSWDDKASERGQDAPLKVDDDYVEPHWPVSRSGSPSR